MEKGFAQTVVTHLNEGESNSLWIREDSSIIFYPRGNAVGHGNRSLQTVRGSRRLSEAMEEMLTGIHFSDVKPAITVPSPQQDLERVFQAMEKANQEIKKGLPGAHFFPRFAEN